jgi:hypothetical protein
VTTSEFKAQNRDVELLFGGWTTVVIVACFSGSTRKNYKNGVLNCLNYCVISMLLNLQR